MNLTVQNSTLDLADLFTAAGVTRLQSISINWARISKFFPNNAGIRRQRRVSGFHGLDSESSSRMTHLSSRTTVVTHGAHQLSFGMDYINLRAFATITC